MNAQSMLRVSTRVASRAVRVARLPAAFSSQTLDMVVRSAANRGQLVGGVQWHPYRLMSSETAEKANAEEGQEEQSSAADQPTDAAAEEANGSETEELKERISQLEEQLKEMTDIRVRLLAEMENVRAIAKRDVDSSRTYAIGKFAKQMLDVADNLHRALESVPKHELENEENTLLRNLFYGVEATDSELRKILKSHDIEEFGKVGEPFDPNCHEAMFQTAHSDQDSGSIAQVLKTGFTFKDRILRPAQVGTAE